MNLAYLTGAVAVLVIGVILARLLSNWADLALTSNTRIEPTGAKFLSNIIRYALWAVADFALIGSWGLVRLPSLMKRLHGPTKAASISRPTISIPPR